MKKLLILALSVCAGAALAQDTQPTPKLNDLFISSAPGLVLADKSTTTIQQPTTPRAFAVSLINLGQGGAVETAPYWWSGGAGLSFESYTQMQWPVLQTLDISVASFTTNGIVTLAPGIRSQIFKVANRKTLELYHIWQEAFLDNSPQGQAKAAVLKKKLDSLGTKGVLSLDVAASILGTTSGTPPQSLDFNKSGVWSNISWNPSTLPFGLVGLAKYSWSNTNAVNSKYLDFGGQVNYTTDKLLLAAEYVNRRDFSAGQNYSKLTASFSYAVTDNIQVVASYGKDLQPGDGLIALLGVNFGVSRK